MAYVIGENPGLLLKLSATSMSIKVALANLITYHHSVVEEKKKDREYYEMLAAAYADSEDDLKYAEMFTSVSSEVDILLSELKDLNEE